MKNVLIGLLLSGAISAFASERVGRLDKNTIDSITTNVECTQNIQKHGNWYGAKHVISVQTNDGIIADFVYESELLDQSNCEKAKEQAVKAHSTRLMYLTAIKNGTLRIIEKKDNVVCAHSYTDVVVSEQGKLIGSMDGLTPIKCP